jgi:hypothetical protein
MTGMRSWPGLTALVLSVTLVACSSKDPALYTISPVPAAAQSFGPRVIVVQQIGLARYLERLQIVRSSASYQLEVMQNDWWGEPLSGMLNRVLVADLGQRLPQSAVISEIGSITTTPDATVQLNLQRLDSDAAGNLVLQAQVGVVFKGHSGAAPRAFRFTVTPTAPGVPGQVAATSVAVGQLADGIVSMLSAGPTSR